MKKLVLFTFLATFLISCGASKVVQQSEKTLKGDWTLNSITYGKTGTFHVTLLNDSSPDCFEGSSWHFVSNNNTGTYNLNKDDCPAGERYFVFTVQEIDKDTGLYDFMLKPTDEKYKSEFNRGFRLQLTQLTEGSMQWEQTANLKGETLKIFMNFTKAVE